jgi:hypothetical protein
MSGMSESWSLPWHKLQRRVAAGPIAIAPAGSWLVRARSTNCHLQRAASSVGNATGAPGFNLLADAVQVCCNFGNEVQLPPGVPSDPVPGTSLSNE